MAVSTSGLTPEPTLPLAPTLLWMGRRVSSRPQMKERVEQMETFKLIPSTHFLPSGHTSGSHRYFGFENKASDLFWSKFFSIGVGPGACGHPGRATSQKLTRFPSPLKTNEQVRLATFSFSSWPGRRGHRERVGLLGGGRVSQCLPVAFRGRPVCFFSQNLLSLSIHPPPETAHTHTHTHTNTDTHEHRLTHTHKTPYTHIHI